MSVASRRPRGRGAEAKRMRRRPCGHANFLQDLPIAVSSVFKEMSPSAASFATPDPAAHAQGAPEAPLLSAERGIEARSRFQRRGKRAPIPRREAFKARKTPSISFHFLQFLSANRGLSMGCAGCRGRKQFHRPFSPPARYRAGTPGDDLKRAWPRRKPARRGLRGRPEGRQDGHPHSTPLLSLSKDEPVEGVSSSREPEQPSLRTYIEQILAVVKSFHRPRKGGGRAIDAAPERRRRRAGALRRPPEGGRGAPLWAGRQGS